MTSRPRSADNGHSGFRGGAVQDAGAIVRGLREGDILSHEPLKTFRHFLVPLDGSDASYHGLAAACEIARKTKAQVSVLHVIEVPRTLPVDADMQHAFDDAESILDRAEQLAGKHKLKIDTEMVQARQAGHAVVDEAIESGVDAIVVGVDYHRPLGRFRLGRLPQYVLAYAPCEVWLLRSAPGPGQVVIGADHQWE